MAVRGAVAGAAANAWKQYDPRILCAANGAVTQPDLGSPFAGANASTLRGRYKFIEPGETVLAQIQTQFGFSPSAGAGSCYVWRLPVPARRWESTTELQVIGLAHNYKSQAPSYNEPVIATLADPWTSLGGMEDYYLQLFSPYMFARGTATITAGSNSVAVPHTLGITPTPTDVYWTVSDRTGQGSNNHMPYGVSATDATNVTLQLQANASLADLQVAWKVRAEPKSAVVGSWLVGPNTPWPVNTFQDVFIQIEYEIR